jgi:hypothetical protein
MAVDHLIDYIRDPRQTIDKHPELFDNQKQEEIKVKEGVQFQKTLKDKLDLDLRELSDIKKTERAWRGIIIHFCFIVISHTPMHLSHNISSLRMIG